MFPRPPSSTLTDTLFPNTALVRSPPLLHGQVGVRSLFIDSIENSRSHSLDCERTRRIQGLLSAVRRGAPNAAHCVIVVMRSEAHTSELQSLMRISYAVFCLKPTTPQIPTIPSISHHTITPHITHTSILI